MKRILSTIILATLSVIGFAEMQYIEIDSIQNATIIKLKSLADFESLINKNNIATAYLQTSSKDVLINIGSTYFSFPLKGYASINDYKAGERAGYKDGAEYTEAKSLGLPTVDLYYFYKRNNFQSVADCIDANKNGFTTHARLETRKTNQESDAYYKAKELGYIKYADYKEYLAYTGLGYKTKADWQDASKKGFTNAREFYEAQEQKFANYDDYKTAHELGLETNTEFKKYNDTIKPIEKIVQDTSLDKKSAIIYYHIQLLPKGEELSLNKLSQKLKNNYDGTDTTVKQALSKYVNDSAQTTSSQKNQGYTLAGSRYRSTNYTQINISTLFDESSLRDFFDKATIDQLGSYSSKSEIFKRK